MAEQFVPPISVDQLTQLGRWQLVALAARSVLRIAPLFLPAKSASPREARLQLGAMDVCVMFPALSAVRGKATEEPRLARAADDMITTASKQYRDFDPQFHSARAAGLVATAALDKPLGKLVTQVLDAISESIAAVQTHEKLPQPGGAKVPDCAKEVRTDYERLSTVTLGENGEVPGQFFLGPVWPGGSLWWDQVVRGWEQELEGHKLGDLITERRVMDSGTISWESAARRMEKWGAEAVQGYRPEVQIEGWPEPDEPSRRGEEEPQRQAKGSEVAEEPVDSTDAAGLQTGTVSAEGLNVRIWPKSEATIIGRWKKGNRVTILEVAGDWLQASYQGLTGYVQKSSVSVPETETPAASAKADDAPPSAKGATPEKKEAETATVKRPDLRMLADTPVDDETDRLNFGPYADALAGLIDHPETKTPFVIAINAPWGSGKSSLARMIERRLAHSKITQHGKSRKHIQKSFPERQGRPAHLTCWFNAWQHDDAKNLGAALAAEAARAANEQRALWRRLLKPLPWALLTPTQQNRRSIWFWSLTAVFLGGGAAGALVSWFGIQGVARLAGKLSGDFKTFLEGYGEFLGTTVPGLSGLLLLVGKFLSTVIPAARSVSEYVANPESTLSTGSLKEVGAQLGRLIHQATRGKRRFIIFVDDLERCQPPRAIEVLEVVNQLLNHKDVVTVVMADMPAVAACAEIKYKELAERYSPGAGVRVEAGQSGQQAYGRLYLQKIIQFQFDLPPVPKKRIQQLVAELARRKTRTAPKKRNFLKLLQDTGLWFREGFRELKTDEQVLRNKERLIRVWREIQGRVRRAKQSIVTIGGETWMGCGVAILYAILSLYGQWATLRWWISLAHSVMAILLGLSLGAGTRFAREKLASWRARRRDQKAAQTVRAASAVAKGDPAKTEAVSILVALEPARNGGAGLSQVEKFINQPPSLLAEAEALARQHLPGGESRDRRLLRRVQVYAFLSQTETIPGAEGLTGPGLGKWAVLCERWPDLAEALTTASLRDLEEAARRDDAEGFEEECIAYLPNADDLSDLRSLLRVEPPVLPVFAALARLHRKARKRFEELDTDLFWLGVQRNLTDDSLLLDRAQDEALRHIPPMPRNAKRLLNRLRVLMVMAAGRSLFSGSDERTEHMARCLGKWAVLCERWPELAQALIEDPDRMEELERAADKGTMYGFSRIAQRIAPGLASEEDLREFCESAVKLGPERNWLAHFEPVQAAQNGDGAASATGTNSNKPDAA